VWTVLESNILGDMDRGPLVTSWTTMSNKHAETERGGETAEYSKNAESATETLVSVVHVQWGYAIPGAKDVCKAQVGASLCPRSP
jgi:hypothetical protein